MIHLLAVWRKRSSYRPPHKLGARDRLLFGNLIQQLEIFFGNVNECTHDASYDIQIIYHHETEEYIKSGVFKIPKAEPGTPGNVLEEKDGELGFVVSHPFHDETMEWMGHPTFKGAPPAECLLVRDFREQLESFADSFPIFYLFVPWAIPLP
jgi:hypothetical protein